jgi:hypothetical protein
MDETGNETNEAAAPAGGAGSDMKRLRLMLLVLVLAAILCSMEPVRENLGYICPQRGIFYSLYNTCSVWTACIGIYMLPYSCFHMVLLHMYIPSKEAYEQIVMTSLCPLLPVPKSSVLTRYAPLPLSMPNQSQYQRTACPIPSSIMAPLSSPERHGRPTQPRSASTAGPRRHDFLSTSLAHGRYSWPAMPLGSGVRRPLDLPTASPTQSSKCPRTRCIRPSEQRSYSAVATDLSPPGLG